MKDTSHAAAPAARIRRQRSRRGNAASPLPPVRPRDRMNGVRKGLAPREQE